MSKVNFNGKEIVLAGDVWTVVRNGHTGCRQHILPSCQHNALSHAKKWQDASLQIEDEWVDTAVLEAAD
jgi:hypothetical protein